MILTKEKLRKAVTNETLLPFLDKILDVTDGLSKPGKVQFTLDEMFVLITECSIYHPHPSMVIAEVLIAAVVYPKESANITLQETTGLKSVFVGDQFVELK